MFRPRDEAEIRVAFRWANHLIAKYLASPVEVLQASAPAFLRAGARMIPSSADQVGPTSSSDPYGRTALVPYRTSKGPYAL